MWITFRKIYINVNNSKACNGMPHRDQGSNESPLSVQNLRSASYSQSVPNNFPIPNINPENVEIPKVDSNEDSMQVETIWL